MRTFHAVFEPDDGGWHVRIQEVKGCISWGRALPIARRNIREALATCVDILGPRAAEIARTAMIKERVLLPSYAQAALERKRKAEHVEARAAHEKTTNLHYAVKTLRKAGLSLRDTAELMGLSHESVRKLSG